MILHEIEHGVVCIGQAAHSWVSGRLARSWGNGRFPRPEPFEAFCHGAAMHDIGMAEWDLRPSLDPETGWPTAFTDLPPATHIALWSAAPRMVLSQSPYAALMVSLHGHALYASRGTKEPDPDESALVRAYVAEQEAFHERMVTALDLDRAQTRHNQKLLWLLDFLALAPLTGWLPDDLELGGETLRFEAAGPLAMSVDPWPFGPESLEIAFPGRLLTERSGSTEELHERLEAAPWVNVTVSWTPRSQ